MPVHAIDLIPSSTRFPRRFSDGGSLANNRSFDKQLPRSGSPGQPKQQHQPPLHRIQQQQQPNQLQIQHQNIHINNRQTNPIRTLSPSQQFSGRLPINRRSRTPSGQIQNSLLQNSMKSPLPSPTTPTAFLQGQNGPVSPLNNQSLMGQTYPVSQQPQQQVSRQFTTTSVNSNEPMLPPASQKGPSVQYPHLQRHLQQGRTPPMARQPPQAPCQQNQVIIPITDDAQYNPNTTQTQPVYVVTNNVVGNNSFYNNNGRPRQLQQPIQQPGHNQLLSSISQPTAGLTITTPSNTTGSNSNNLRPIQESILSEISTHDIDDYINGNNFHSPPFDLSSNDLNIDLFLNSESELSSFTS